MQPIHTITGTAVPLERSDVDTDQIIPSEWLKRVERTGFGEGLFSEWREDPEFVLNKTEYRGASILVAGPNFGTGSSREHAVWALTDYGFAAVISPRFGDIFRNNSTKAGLVPVVLTAEEVAELQEAIKVNPQLEVEVDVEARTVRAEGFSASFPLDDFTQHRLLNGLDDIGLTLRHVEKLDAYEKTRLSHLPSAASATTP